MPVHDDDARLIAALRSGDEAAFRAFSTSIHRPLLGLVRRFVPEGAAPDVVQQTWVGVFESLDQFEGRSRLSTWVLQIGLNLARATAGRAGREVPLADGEPDESCFDEEGYWAAPPRDWSAALQDPEHLAANQELLRLLEQGLRALPEAWRAAVVLCDVEGLAPQEAAAVLEVEGGHLRVLLHRGRVRLRQGLEAALVGPP